MTQPIGVLGMPQDFIATITHLIETRTGLAVSTRLREDALRLIQQQSEGNLEGWLTQLTTTPETSPVWQRLLAQLTVGETYFMRDKAHFKALREHILPTLLLQKRADGDLTLTLWSAGCASGEEAYSLAIVLYELLPDSDRWKINVIGTDINATAIENAKRGVYRAWSFRQNDDGFIKRYFTPQDDVQAIKPFLKQWVDFSVGNLMGGDIPPCDIIFCRNVFLYCTQATIARAEKRLFDTLKMGGWLVLGQAEAVRYTRDLWLMHIYPNAPLYQKPHLKPALTDDRVRYVKRSESDTHDIASTPTADLSAVEMAIRSGDQEQAERLLADILTQYPRHVKAKILLAFLFASRKAYPEAISHLEQVLRQNPLSADAHYLRGVIAIEQGQADLAIQSLQASLYCQREHVLALLMMGTLALQTNDAQRAFKYWLQAKDWAERQPLDEAVSVFSDLTARQIVAFVQNQLG